jgi:hypothetical protein
MPENPYQSPKEVNEPARIRPASATGPLRFGLPAIGAFVFAVFPGMYVSSSPGRAVLEEVYVLMLLLASSGAILGTAIFRLASWSRPTRMDAAIIATYTLAFAFIGYWYFIQLGR